MACTTKNRRNLISLVFALAVICLMTAMMIPGVAAYVGFPVTPPAPTVNAITPATGVNTSGISITNLSGTGFLSGATVKLNRTGLPDITGASVVVNSPTNITCTFPLTGKVAGVYTVNVTNSDGQSGVLFNGFTVTNMGTSGASLVNLGSAGTFAILSETGITDVPASPITGDVGSSPITGAAIHVTCPEVTGTIYTVDDTGPACKVISPTLLTSAVNDMYTAYVDAAGRTTPTATELGAGHIGGMTLAPGLYKWSSDVDITTATDLTLDAQGNPDAVWIFQVAKDLTMASNTHMILANGANATHVFWQIGGPTGVAIGTGAHAEGNILSVKAITMQTGATLNGSALAQSAVTLQQNTIFKAPSGTKPAPTVTGITPVTGFNTSTIAITNLSGTGFLSGATVKLTRLGYPDISATGITVVSPTKITCTFDLTHKVAGLYNVTVTNPDGTYGTLTNGFAVGISWDRVGTYLNGAWKLDRNGNVTWDGSPTDGDYTWGWSAATPVVSDWNGDGTQKLGVYYNGQWWLDANGNGVWDGPTVDKYYTFGQAGDTPVVGDWNHDGKTEIGTYNAGTWKLDYNGNGVYDGPSTDRLYTWGWSASTPIVGDWNHDGKTKIGVYYQGNWWLDYNGNGVWDGNVVDRQYTWGWSASTPIVGDWNGDGKTKIGVYYNGLWWLDYDGNGVWDGNVVDRQYTWGWSASTPIVGDWNHDGTTKIGVYYNGQWWLDANGNGVWDGTTIDKSGSFGDAGGIPVIGKWK